MTIILEDLGALHLNTITTPRSQSVPPVGLTIEKQMMEKIFSFPFQQNVGLDHVFQRPNEDVQLQAAYELQLWKESKELEFEKHVWIDLRHSH